MCWANVRAEGWSRFEIISEGQFTRMLSHFDLSLFSFTTRWPFAQQQEYEYANESRAERSDVSRKRIFMTATSSLRK